MIWLSGAARRAFTARSYRIAEWGAFAYAHIYALIGMVMRGPFAVGHHD